MPLGEEWLKDFLSEMLAVEKGGVKLYEKALSELKHSELEQKLTDFLRQTQRHVELCTEMLEGDPNYQSPGAEAAEHKAEGLLSTQVPPELTEGDAGFGCAKDRRPRAETHGLQSDPGSPQTGTRHM